MGVRSALTVLAPYLPAMLASIPRDHLESALSTLYKSVADHRMEVGAFLPAPPSFLDNTAPVFRFLWVQLFCGPTLSFVS
jgi:hypothetical protein